MNEASSKAEARCAHCGTRNRVPVVSAGTARCGKCRRDLPWLVNVDSQQFNAVIGAGPAPVLVDLWAPWCGPCGAVAPALEQIAEERAGKLRVAKVNVDENPDISRRLGVQGIPTMVLFANGKEIARQVGALPANQIRSWVDGAIS